jgi:hypothetical protein
VPVFKEDKEGEDKGDGAGALEVMEWTILMLAMAMVAMIVMAMVRLVTRGPYLWVALELIWRMGTFLALVPPPPTFTKRISCSLTSLSDTPSCPRVNTLRLILNHHCPLSQSGSAHQSVNLDDVG